MSVAIIASQQFFQFLGRRSFGSASDPHALGRGFLWVLWGKMQCCMWCTSAFCKGTFRTYGIYAVSGATLYSKEITDQRCDVSADDPKLARGRLIWPRSATAGSSVFRAFPLGDAIKLGSYRAGPFAMLRIAKTCSLTPYGIRLVPSDLYFQISLCGIQVLGSTKPKAILRSCRHWRTVFSCANLAVQVQGGSVSARGAFFKTTKKGPHWCGVRVQKAILGADCLAPRSAGVRQLLRTTPSWLSSSSELLRFGLRPNLEYRSVAWSGPKSRIPNWPAHFKIPKALTCPRTSHTSNCKVAWLSLWLRPHEQLRTAEWEARSRPSTASPQGWLEVVSPERLSDKVEGEVTQRANSLGVR